MPRNVKRFAWLFALSQLLIIPAILLIPSPDASLVKLGITRSIEQVIMAVAAVLVLAVELPFFWLTVWRRKNWAKWFLFVLFVISLPLLFVDEQQFQPGHLPMTAISYMSTLLNALAYYFIFAGDAPQWFRQSMPISLERSAQKNRM